MGTVSLHESFGKPFLDETGQDTSRPDDPFEAKGFHLYILLWVLLVRGSTHLLN